MLVLILALLAGCVPSLIVFFWLRGIFIRKNKNNEKYTEPLTRKDAA